MIPQVAAWFCCFKSSLISKILSYNNLYFDGSKQFYMRVYNSFIRLYPRTEFCDYGFDTALYACEISCKQRQFNCTCLIKSMSSVNHYITIAAILQRFL